MTTMMNRYRSNDQGKIKIVCDSVCDDIESLLELFNLEYKFHSRMITMSCPIHGGDNISAVNIYPEGESYRGNWTCRTHGCEKIFKSSIIGFIRGVLSNKNYGWSQDNDKQCSFKEALDFALAFTKKDMKNIKISKSETEKRSFTNVVNYIKPEKKLANNGITRDKVRDSLKIPSSYYIDRHYTTEVLNKYDIGLCENPNKEMYNRVVVPIYNTDYTHMIGCTGRSIFEKCPKCSSHHNLQHDCPDAEKKWIYPKWKHNTDFKSQNHLYNFWFAKEHILHTGYAVIVESPGNVWRLEENNIKTSVGIFGSSMSDRQKILLDSSGAMALVILTDNDAAGDLAAKQIIDKCQNTYRVFRPKITKSDIGEMTSDEIDKEIKSYIESNI